MQLIQISLISQEISTKNHIISLLHNFHPPHLTRLTQFGIKRCKIYKTNSRRRINTNPEFWHQGYIIENKILHFLFLEVHKKILCLTRKMLSHFSRKEIYKMEIKFFFKLIQKLDHFLNWLIIR